MGVRGLTSFVEENSTLLQPHKLSKTTIIIDGDNLVYYLHHLFSVVTANQDHVVGGNYVGFARIIKNFFIYLTASEVQAVVVLDGGYEKSDIKRRTVMSRLRDRIQNCGRIGQKGVCGRYVLPILCRSVFVDVLRELQVRFVQCNFEADAAIAMLSKHFKAPVLSNDSDFFIFDLLHGFIPLHSVNFSLRTDVSKPRKTKYITCMYYHIDNLVALFPGLDKSLLPILSCMMGNDYVEQSVFSEVFSSLPNVDSAKKYRKLRSGEKYKRMMQLLDWMQNKTVDEVIAGVVKLLKLSERKKAEHYFTLTLDSYRDCHYNSLLKYVDTQVSNVKSDLFLPEWFLDAFNSGQIDNAAMNVLILRRLILAPQVEDFSLPSSYSSSDDLRKLYLRILRSVHDGAEPFEIFDRKGTNIFKQEEKELQPLDPPVTTMSTGAREFLLLTSIGATVADITRMQEQLILSADCSPSEKDAEDFSLFLHLCKYWTERTNCSIWKEYLISLIASTLFCFKSRDSENEQKLDGSVFDNRFDKYLVPVATNHSKPLKVNFVHCFSELQAVILFFKRINALLNLPLTRVRADRLLNGTLLYNLTIELCRRVDPILYICQLFGRDSAISALFQELVKEFWTINKISRVPQQASRKKKKRKAATTADLLALEVDVQLLL